MGSETAAQIGSTPEVQSLLETTAKAAADAQAKRIVVEAIPQVEEAAFAQLTAKLQCLSEKLADSMIGGTSSDLAVARPINTSFDGLFEPNSANGLLLQSSTAMASMQQMDPCAIALASPPATDLVPRKRTLAEEVIAMEKNDATVSIESRLDTAEKFRKLHSTADSTQRDLAAVTREQDVPESSDDNMQ